MDASNKNKSFNLVLLLYFVALPFVFFSSVLDPFLLARQLLTTVFLFFALSFLFLKNKEGFFSIDKAVLLFSGFIVFCLVSFSKSLIPDLSHAMFSRYLVFLLFFVLVRQLILNDLVKADQIKKSVILFGLLCIIMASLVFVNKDIVGQHLFRGVNGVSGTFGNKNFLSSILFFCLPFYFIGISISKKLKLISIAAIVLTIILLLILRTRAVIIAVGLYLFLAFLLQVRIKFSKKNFYWFVVSPIVMLIVAVLYLFSIKDHFHSSSDIKIQYFYRLLDSETFYSRLEFWQQAVYVIKDNFFTGIGVGNWMPAYPKYGLSHFSEIDILNGRMIVSNPHNDFLLVLSEIGIFGFLCYVGIFILMLYQACWLTKNQAKASDRKNSGYLLFFIVCYIIIAFFDFPLTRIEHQILLLIVFAIISSNYLKANISEGFKVPNRLIYFFSFFLLLYSTAIVCFRINGERQLFKALEAAKHSDNPTAVFEFNKAKNPFFSTDNYAIPLDWHIGKRKYNTGDFSEGLNHFLAAYKTSPYNIVVNNDLGSAYIKNGNTADGIKHYRIALAISPQYEDARINLAATYYNGKDYEAAFETIDKCAANSKNNSYPQILLPIVEKKLNETLIRMNNPDLNNYLKSKITTEKALLDLYFDYRKKNITFDKYILSLIH